MANIPSSPSPQDAAQMPPEIAKLLSQMHDIDAPAALGWWPLAPGWWILFVIAVLLGTLLVQRSFMWWRGRLYRRQALKLLEQINPENTPEFAAQISGLLKRVALSAYPNQRASIAPAYGAEWVRWLNQTCSEQLFVGEAENALSEGPYRSHIVFDAQVLKTCTKRWIQKHV